MNPRQVIAPSGTVNTRGRRSGACSVKGASLLALLVLLTAVPSAAREAETRALEEGAVLSPADDQGRFVHLIEFAEPGMLRRVARAPRERFDPESPEAVAARAEVMAEQVAHLREMGAALGRTPEVTHYYLVTHSGLAARLTPEEAAAVRRLPGVASVGRERVYELDTYRGPTFIGADTIWDGSATPDLVGSRGEGLVIATLDSGTTPSHPSFANDASCGHGQGGAPDKLLSALDCATTDATGLCNGPSPNDSDGHGTHTSSTSGGNTLDETAVPPPAVPISGVAPCAHVRSYKVCPAQCPGAQIQAGMNSVLLQQLEDGVPIVTMNFSISGGTSPWTDNDRRKLDLVDAGVLVAASAGNTSATIPDPVGNVGHRGPWVMTVAASTHDGLLANPLSLQGGPTQQPALQGTGPAMSADFVGPLRWAGDVDAANVEGCSAFPVNAFDGVAALISRGACNFSVKVINAVAAGADFVVVYNNAGGPPIVMGGLEATTVSSVMVSDTVGAELIDALDGGTAELAVLVDLEAFLLPEIGDVLAGFSLRGPTPAPLADLTKPDISGPGVNIYAGDVPGPYGLISGTSMASPHLAGTATLVRAVRPDWTPPEVKSALMMTAFEDGTKEDLATPWDADDVGSGRADLTKAALAGLVMDEVFDNYLAANPATGGDVKTLNLPAVRNMSCTPSCSWTRTVRNTVTDFPTSWTATGVAITPGFEITIEPSSFSFSTDPMETQELTITATPLTDLTGAVAFGEVVLHEAHAYSPDLHITVAIKGMGEGEEVPDIGLDPTSISATVAQGSSATDTLAISNLGTADLDWTISEEPGDTGACSAPGDVPWLGVSPASGTTAPAGSSPVEVALDAAALEPGDYTANLCVESNDPDQPLIPVPVSLTVIPSDEQLCFTAFLNGDQETPPVDTDATGFGNLSYDADTRELTWEIFHNLNLENVTGAHIHEAPFGEPGPIVIPLDHTLSPIVGSTTLTEDQESDLLSELYYVNIHTMAHPGGEIRGQIVPCGPEAFTPAALAVDPSFGAASDGNGVFEPGEVVTVAPGWRNDGGAPFGLTGLASSFTGPAGATYSLVNLSASYGAVDPSATASCLDTGDCYGMGLDDPAVRPATHWEATFVEDLNDADQTTKTWALHIGDSFTDVPRTSLFYPWIETLLHDGVTGGCTGTTYCPGATVSRDQMSVFLLKALEGAGYAPPACTGVFGDVPCPSLFANWIEDLVARGVTAGCGGGDYCPGNPVSRDQMAVFLLKTLEGPGYTPPACTGAFGDVPCPSLFANWVEDLVARGITAGCGGGNYCPAGPVTRGQMAVFLSKTFGLTLYGP